MNLSRKWLNEFVTVDVNDREFAEAMTLSGSKVEITEDLGAEISNVVVGQILTMERHPDSDHMWICQINVGKDEPVQIVTGAWNIHPGDMVPVALHKSLLPGGKKIEKGKLRGVTSFGMLCSLKELALDERDFPYAVIVPAALLNDYKPLDKEKPSIPADIKAGDKVKVAVDTLGNGTVEGSEESLKLQEVERNFADFLKTSARAASPAEYTKEYIQYYRNVVKYIVSNPHSLTAIPVLFQNITPEFNFTLCYDRFGSGGVLKNERMINKNSYINLNYLGKKYMAHAGFIHDKVSRQENGGVRDNMWIRDTTVEAREIEVALSDASSLVKKNTFFIDQQVRIPFDFIYDMLDTLAERKAVREDEKEYRQRYTEGGMEVTEAGLSAYLHSRKLHRQEAAAEADEGVEYFVPTAFIGHSSELSTYSRYYTDKVSKSDKFADSFYHGVYNYNPSQSSDSLRMMRLDNKLFVRLQPWGEESIVSKLDVGVGDRMQRYYMMDPYYLSTGTSNTWNSFYVYAGARGQYRNYLHWDAKGDYVLLGSEFSDLNIRANAGFNIYPFRRARKSPVSFDLHFQTKLEEPDWYHQHMLTNHFRWDNDFGKISTTKLQGEVSVPRWDLHASAGYALLANTVYFDTLGIARQNPGAISVLTATLEKNFTVGDFLHFDNRLLFQLSSNNDVLPLPSLAVNGRYYAQLKISGGVMLMQLGVDGYWNTAWYAPAWNPAIGVFHNQNEYKYNNGPYFDAFMNIQWKRACIFVKLENAGMGWPMEHKDYFSAHHYINTTRTVKVGIYWPFYTQPAKDTGAAAKLAGGPRGGHSHSH